MEENEKKQTINITKKNLIIYILIFISIVGISLFVYNELCWENKFDLQDVGFDETNKWVVGLFADKPADLRYSSGYLHGTIINKTNKRYEVTINVDFYDDIKNTGKTGSGSDTIKLGYHDSEDFKISIPKYTSAYKIKNISFKKIK